MSLRFARDIVPAPGRCSKSADARRWNADTEMALLFRIKSINQETGRAIDLFRRTALAGISIGIDDLTFA